MTTDQTTIIYEYSDFIIQIQLNNDKLSDDDILSHDDMLLYGNKNIYMIIKDDVENMYYEGVANNAYFNYDATLKTIYDFMHNCLKDLPNYNISFGIDREYVTVTFTCLDISYSMDLFYTHLDRLDDDSKIRFECFDKPHLKKLVCTNNYDSLKTDYDSLKTDYDSLKTDYDSLKTDYDSLKNNYDSLKNDYNSLKNILEQNEK